MKKTAIAIAVGALSIGFSQGLLAQDEDTRLNEQQQMTQQGTQENELGQQSQGREAEYPGADQAGEPGFGDGTDPMPSPSHQSDPINDPTSQDAPASSGGAPSEASNAGESTDPMASPSQQTDPINDPTATDEQTASGGAKAEASNAGESADSMQTPSQQSDPVNGPFDDEDEDY